MIPMTACLVAQYSGAEMVPAYPAVDAMMRMIPFLSLLRRVTDFNPGELDGVVDVDVYLCISVIFRLIPKIRPRLHVH